MNILKEVNFEKKRQQATKIGILRLRKGLPKVPEYAEMQHGMMIQFNASVWERYKGKDKNGISG